MRAIVCKSWGEPAEVLQLDEVEPPRCGPGQVRVRMLASPINPSDLFLVRGLYGYLPSLPCTPGFEGVGIVEEGHGLLAWRVKGRRVAVLNGAGGNWADQVVIPARAAVPIPDSLSDEQAATFFVNPATAIVLTRYVLPLRRGDWLLQTAAGSALGRMVIRLGKKYGFRTINIVRRQEQADELRRLGADAVIVYPGEDVPARVRELTEGKGATHAIDAVCGETGAQCLAALAPRGRLILYSSLSLKPLPVDPRLLMNADRRVEGFWLSTWVKQQNPLRMLGLFRQIAALIREGVADTQIGQTFSLEQIRQAVTLAGTPGRQGKVLLRINAR